MSLRLIGRSLLAPRPATSGLLAACSPRLSAARMSTQADANDLSKHDPNYAIQTNTIPWIDVPNAPGLQCKPVRASRETGAFTCVMRLAAGADYPDVMHLGATNFMVLNGELTYDSGPMKGEMGAGTWAYMPANSQLAGKLKSDEGVEYHQDFYGPMVFMEPGTKTVKGVFSAEDVRNLADAHGVPLVASSYEESKKAYGRAEITPFKYEGGGEALRAYATGTAAIPAKEPEAGTADKRINPHFVDTSKLTWFEAQPGINLKILRVSDETGTISLLVKHQGVAGAHQHLGASDFLILTGTLGLVGDASPDGYGGLNGYTPGTWVYEDNGARHEATQPYPGDDLVYLANVHGPICYDSGPGTQVLAVASFLAYKQMAAAAGHTLVENTFTDDQSLLAGSSLVF